LLLLHASRVCSAPVVTVKLEGLDGELRENVLSYLTIEQEKNAADLTGRRIRRYYERADREIRQALQPFGFYHPLIEAELSHEDGDWLASYHVDAGPPVTISSLDIAIEGPGKDEASLDAALKELPLMTGERLVHADYEKAKAQLRAAVLELGYREAQYSVSQVRVYQESNRAEVVLHLDTGRKYHFGTVSFTGSDLSEELLHAYVPFHPGETWSTRKLLRLQRDLVDSNYFSAVNIVPQNVPEASTEVPLEINLVPNKKQKYSFGLGYSTDTGPLVSFDWLHRKLNRRGHYLGAGTTVSQVRQDLSGTYSIPLSRPNTDVLEITASLRREDTDDVVSRIRELRVSHNTEQGKWRQVLSLGYKREDYDVGDSDDLANLLIPRATWTRVDADNRLVARKGYRLELETSGAHRNLLSDTSFLQGITRGKLIYPLGPDLRLVTRADLGASALNDLDQLPASNRFFTGGDNSVRGYGYRTLGPTNEAGELIGGKYLAVGSIGLDYRFIDKWYIAVFFDSGNAFNELPVHARHGTGFGIRWASPVGMVRVDLASAISKPGDPWRLHVNFGPDF
jgi:translocation and assembly module TamA